MYKTCLYRVARIHHRARDVQQCAGKTYAATALKPFLTRDGIGFRVIRAGITRLYIIQIILLTNSLM